MCMCVCTCVCTHVHTHTVLDGFPLLNYKHSPSWPHPVFLLTTIYLLMIYKIMFPT